jgi:hypothetical protein
MAGTIIVIAIAIFAAGISVGAIVVVTVGIRREERDFARSGLVSLTRQAPGQASQAGRLATGLYVRQPSDLYARSPHEDLLV